MPVLDGRFALRVSFRALQPDGVIVTMSSDYIASQFLIVYLREGHIVASMTSSSHDSNTRHLTSKYTYDDAQWWQVRLTVNIAKTRGLSAVSNKIYRIQIRWLWFRVQ